MSTPSPLDAAAVRAVVTLEDVLVAHGHALPRRGHRMSCPVHGGRNTSAFSLTRESRFFRCFNCGVHGDVVDLERELGGGTTDDALQRLCDRHNVAVGRVDLATERRRQWRLRRLNAWHQARSNEWTTALVKAEQAVREWQCESADAGELWWNELERRVNERDRCEAMVETFRELRTVEERARAFAVEQRGVVVLPDEALCA